MRMGARWRAGEPPHQGVPAGLHAAIAAQEREHPDGSSWTLTWLEGRPRCELGGIASHPGLVVISLDAAGEVVVTSLDAGVGSGIGSGSEGTHGLMAQDEDLDDDDWLS